MPTIICFRTWHQLGMQVRSTPWILFHADFMQEAGHYSAKLRELASSFWPLLAGKYGLPWLSGTLSFGRYSLPARESGKACIAGHIAIPNTTILSGQRKANGADMAVALHSVAHHLPKQETQANWKRHLQGQDHVREAPKWLACCLG